MKSRASFPNIPSTSMEVSVPEENVEKMVVKTEQVSHESEDDDYQKYVEAEMNDQFDESNNQEHADAGTDNVPTEAEMDDPLDENTYENLDEAGTSNLSTDSKGRFI